VPGAIDEIGNQVKLVVGVIWEVGDANRMKTRDLGNMGQSLFSLWCGSNGMTANESHIDRHGWDFLVEFPLVPKNGLPVDVLPPPLECKVQVKSTDRRDRIVRMTVSSLHRLVLAHMPAFICLIEFGGTNEARAAYLVHVDRKVMERTLRRIRELDAKGLVEARNRRTITIKCTEQERLDAPFDKNLMQAIIRHVPTGLEDYTKNKCDMLKTLGFEEGAAKLTFSVSGNDAIDNMVALWLGLKSELAIDGITLHHHRFGITLPTPCVQSGKGILTFIDIKPSTRGTITFREHDLSPGISFPIELYFPPLGSVLPPEHMKIRIKHWCFDLVFSPATETMSFKFDLSSEHASNLKELHDILGLLVLINKPHGSLEIEIEPDNLPAGRTALECSGEPENWPRLLMLSERAVSICQRLGIKVESINLDIDTLIKNSSSIERFHRVMQGTADKARIQFSATGDKPPVQNKMACVVFLSLSLGDHVVGLHLALIGAAHLTDDEQYCLDADELLWATPLVLKRDRPFEEKAISKDFDRFSEVLIGKGLVCVRLVSPTQVGPN
jgi:hypothetical protein